MWRGQQTKLQSHPVPIFLPAATRPLLPPLGLRFILTHIGLAHISVYRYRSYIEVEFQSSPHRVDDRVYLKEKKARRRLQV